jgi:hypothetical protein
VNDVEPAADPRTTAKPQTQHRLALSPGDLVEVTSVSGLAYRARVLDPGEFPGNLRVRVVGDYPGTLLGFDRVTIVRAYEGDIAVKVDCEPDDYLHDAVDDWPGGPRFDLKVTRGRRVRPWSQSALAVADERGLRLPVVWEYESERWTGQDGRDYGRFVWLHPLY